MAPASKASNARSVPHLPLRKPSVANLNRKRPSLGTKAAITRPEGIVWDLHSLPAVQEAAVRVREAHSAWQHQLSTTEEVERLDGQRKHNLILAERERRDEVNRVANRVREAKIAEEERFIANAREHARQAELAAQAARLAEDTERRRLEAEQRRLADEQRTRAEEARLAEEAERRRWEAEQRRLADEERRRAEEEIAELLRQEEEDMISRLEAELAAEQARVAEEAERRARQAHAEEQRRRARLRDCAACLEQHDLAVVVQLACEHWYCHDDLRGRCAPIDVPKSLANDRQMQFRLHARLDDLSSAANKRPLPLRCKQGYRLCYLRSTTR